MLIENELALPVPPTEAWSALLDLERITGVDGEIFERKANIKVSPITADTKASPNLSNGTRKQDPEVTDQHG